MGFSRAVNDAKRVAQEIIDNGHAALGQLGVSVKSKPAGTQAGHSGFTTCAEAGKVTAGSAADKAKLKAGDVIISLEDRPIFDTSELTAGVREQAAGANDKFAVLRGNQQHSVTATLDAAQLS
ncbi:MAG: S1C family serine protease [Actinomycetota bacterium]|nr:S1C family serine protease [Actinomycetota bacterium]